MTCRGCTLPRPISAGVGSSSPCNLIQALSGREEWMFTCFQWLFGTGLWHKLFHCTSPFQCWYTVYWVMKCNLVWNAPWIQTCDTLISCTYIFVLMFTEYVFPWNIDVENNYTFVAWNLKYYSDRNYSWQKTMIRHVNNKWVFNFAFNTSTEYACLMSKKRLFHKVGAWN